MSRKSRDKGARGERELAKEISRLFRVEARRGVQYQGGPDSPDVVAEIPGIHWEAKRTEKLSLYAALDQAIGEAGEGSIPVVAHRRNGKPWLAVVRLDDLPDLVVKLFHVLVDNA